MLNVIGHQGTAGIALEEQQRLCIDEARMGMYALSLEWVGVGELAQPGNAHANLASLDLTGARGLGLMYLADSKALDYLLSLPGVDASRIGMTGLSGGGFQTILLGSLDARISVAIPVAGFSAGISKMELPSGHGDIEHLTSDFLSDVDYPTLVALRAPRPTLLIYNRNDNCCNRAALMKPWVYDAIRPFFGADADSHFAWHTNLIPGTHNYETDNRAVALAFFARHFHVPPPRAEAAVETDLLDRQQITVGLPENALTIATLARQFAEHNQPSASGSMQERRELLRHIVRYPETVLTRAWPLGVYTTDVLQTTELRFQFSDGLTAFGVLRRRLDAPHDAPPEILFSDEDVLSVDSPSSAPANNSGGTLTIALPLTSSGAKKQVTDYAELLSAFGERPLGMEAAQLNEIARWMKTQFDAGTVSLQTTGVRSQLISLVASAIQPAAFANVQHLRGLSSLTEVFTRPIAFKEAPEVFCLGLQKSFDVGELEVLGRHKTGSRKSLTAH